MPIAARTSARAPKNVSKDPPRRCAKYETPMEACKDRVPYTGSAESIEWMAPSTARDRASGSLEVRTRKFVSDANDCANGRYAAGDGFSSRLWNFESLTTPATISQS